MRTLLVFFIFVSIATIDVNAQKAVSPLVSFTIANEPSYNLIEWSSSQDLMYEVEVSTDRRRFKTISETFDASKSGKYLDQHPAKGNNYYRLKMIDGSGKVTYGPIKMAKNE